MDTSYFQFLATVLVSFFFWGRGWTFWGSRTTLQRDCAKLHNFTHLGRARGWRVGHKSVTAFFHHLNALAIFTSAWSSKYILEQLFILPLGVCLYIFPFPRIGAPVFHWYRYSRSRWINSLEGISFPPPRVVLRWQSLNHLDAPQKSRISGPTPDPRRVGILTRTPVCQTHIKVWEALVTVFHSCS